MQRNLFMNSIVDEAFLASIETMCPPKKLASRKHYIRLPAGARFACKFCTHENKLSAKEVSKRRLN